VRRDIWEATSSTTITAGICGTRLPTVFPSMFNILLVPLDGSLQSVPVIDLVSSVAAPGTATVHLLCVVDPSYALPPGTENGVAPDGLIYPFAHAETSFAHSVLAAGAAQLANRNLKVEQHFCAGNPPDVIIEQARVLTAEVIVMGHHRVSRLHRWLNPSTCVQVIDRSPCAVLIETREAASVAYAAAMPSTGLPFAAPECTHG
jgi:nucleotide-binding universal stress UspA family protein